ncbi:MAG: PRC-barrel domain-containing protein [Chloroflexota bacterium]
MSVYELSAKEIYDSYARNNPPAVLLAQGRDGLAARLQVEEGLTDKEAYYAADQMLTFAQNRKELFMEFKEGADIYTMDGDKVGEVSRVVIEPDTKEITHVIVQKGFLFTEDKVVPIDAIQRASEDRVVLRQDVEDLDQFQDFEETYYMYADAEREPFPAMRRPVPALYWYPPVGVWGMPGGPAYYGSRVYSSVKEENIPEGTVALEEGARVISSDGEHVGDIERVYTEPSADRATHVLISKGLIMKERKIIPTQWMTNIMEGEIHLSVDSELVGNLPEYVNQA